MDEQQSNVAKSLYVLYEALPNEVQQAFLQELKTNQPEKQTHIEEDSIKDSIRTDEQQKRAIEIYDAYRDDLRKRQLSNNENYDKTVLTLSSSGLALSLTAIKFAIPLEKAKYLFLIQGSWWLFGATILISIIAYWISNKALDIQLKNAEDYYSKDNEDAFSKKNWYSDVNDWLNMTAGVTFIIATALIISFVTYNINYREFEMSDITDKIGLESMSVPPMQRIDQSIVPLSATIPPMQLAPSPSPTQQQQQTTQSTGGDKKK